MYATHGTWDEYTHLEAHEAEQVLDMGGATGLFTREDDEGSTLLAWTRDEEPKGNPYHAQHVLSRRPLAEMLRDANHEQLAWLKLTPDAQRKAARDADFAARTLDGTRGGRDRARARV